MKISNGFFLVFFSSHKNVDYVYLIVFLLWVRLLGASCTQSFRQLNWLVVLYHDYSEMWLSSLPPLMMGSGYLRKSQELTLTHRSVTKIDKNQNPFDCLIGNKLCTYLIPVFSAWQAKLVNFMLFSHCWIFLMENHWTVPLKSFSDLLSKHIAEEVLGKLDRI